MLQYVSIILSPCYIAWLLSKYRTEMLFNDSVRKMVGETSLSFAPSNTTVRLLGFLLLSICLNDLLLSLSLLAFDFSFSLLLPLSIFYY